MRSPTERRAPRTPISAKLTHWVASTVDEEKLPTVLKSTCCVSLFLRQQILSRNDVIHKNIDDALKMYNNKLIENLYVYSNLGTLS